MVTPLFFSAERFSLLSALLKASIKAWTLSVRYRSNLLCISVHLANTEPSALFYLRWFRNEGETIAHELKSKAAGQRPVVENRHVDMSRELPCLNTVWKMPSLAHTAFITRLMCTRKILGWESSFTRILLKAAAPETTYVSKNNTCQLGIWPF